MKQRITFTMLLLWILSSVIPLGTAFASPITIQQAQQNAMDFLKKKGKTVSNTALRDVSSKDATSKNYYVFNIGNNEGFVIAAADDQVPAILGYSSRGTVLIEAMPANLKAWLDSYDKQIRSIQEQGLTGSAPITSTHAAISPLMTTTWDQDDPYNQSCPDFFTYGKSVTGCVATAMAQIMYYHRNRSVSQIAATIPAYTCRSKWNSDDGTQQISVDAVPAGSVIDWNNMLTHYTGSETEAQKKAVADLMFYCGASVSMNYANGENGGSGAYSEDVPGALKTYFGYSDNTQLVSRDDYTNDSWDNLIYNELSNHRPVFYSGVTSSNGGHAFVCDGCDSDGYYHINWGWGGYCDTYFLLSDLTPQDQGTGGSSGGYNNNQRAIIGAEPSGNVIPPVQQYTVSVNSLDSHLHIYDKNGNDITDDVHNGVKYDAGSYFHFVLEIGDAYYISEIKVNGVSVGQWGEDNKHYEYEIESLSSDMTVEFTFETPVKYRTVYCAANGPGNVKMYKNGTYVGTTPNNGSGNRVVSAVINPTGGDEIKLEFIPDDGCKLSRLGCGFYDVDTETTDISNEISNNTYTLKYLIDEYGYHRCFNACFERVETSLNVVNQDSVANIGFACVEVPALYYQPVIYAKDINTKNEAYYYIDKTSRMLKGNEWRFCDGVNAPPITLSGISLNPEDMDGYDYTGESQENTMWMNYNAWVEKFKALKTAKLVPYAFVSYRMSGVLPSLADFTFDLLTNTSVVNADVESRSTGYNLSMANNFVSPVYTNGSYYHYNLGFLQVPFKVRDWGKYVEDLAYYVSSNNGKTLKDSVNFISLQLTNKNDNSTIVSDEAAVIPAFLHINAIVDNEPENKILDCIIDDDKWPTKQNQNAGAMYTNAQQAINSTYTHTIRYKHKIDILPYIETHYTYIGINSNWDADNRVMDAKTFRRLGLKYVFSIVDYEDGNHAAGESRHVSIDAKPSYNYGFGYDKVFLIPQSINYQDNGSSFEQVPATREAIGHEPLIKVEIIDPNNNVLYVGYIKLLITDEGDIDEGVIFDTTNFPDPTFRAYISDQMGVLEGGTISDEELQSINSFYKTYATITDLKGIEYFTALTSLHCSNNQLTTLDVSKNTVLTHLSCGNNQLTTLDVSKNTVLTHLSCGNNQLMSLDVSKNTALSSLSCAAQSVTLIAHKVGNNQYQIAVPSDFDLSKVSDFKVNDEMASPTHSAGLLTFSSSSTPQTIKYNYATGYNDKNMDVTVNITSIEEPNYDNTIYMEDMEVLSGTEAVLSVKMKNTVVVEGFEFDMYLPEGITVMQDEDGFPDVTLSTERTNSRKTNSFDAIFNADGSLRVLAASTNGSTISGNDGEVVQVKVALADDMIEGDYTVCFKNIAISDENAVSYNSPMTTSTIKVNTYIVGDANIDKKVDVADFTATAHHLLNRTPEKFHQKAADANTDNKIDVGDLTAIAHLILYGSVTKPTNTAGARPYMMLSGTPANENYIYIEPVSVQGKSEVTLSVKMKNAVEAEGFEFDLYLPDGMTFVTDADGFAEVSLSTERTNSRKTNSFDAVIQQDGSLRVLAASTNGSSISGNDGEVALVTIHVDPDLNAGEYPLLLKNIAISDVNAVSHSTDLQESTITILGNGIITDVEKVQSSKFNVQSDEWYSLDGKKLNSKPKAKGVYIMNRQKVVIK